MKNCNHFLGNLCGEEVFKEDFLEKIINLSESQKHLAEYNLMNGEPNSPKQIVDGRKGYLFRFNFCPYCGEKLNWKEILAEIK